MTSRKSTGGLHFGFVVPLQGEIGRRHLPILMAMEPRYLPVICERFDSLWVYDHLYAFGKREAPYMESWTSLTWLAARVPDIPLGTLVLGVGYRNPALLAKMAATLQTLSGGRLVLGIGAGWREEEYPAYAYPFPPAPVRIDQLEEAVRIIRSMWTERAPSFHGKYFSIENAYCSPQPDPPPPIMIGGGGEKRMLPLIGRLADWWNVGDARSIAAYRRKRDIVLASAAEAGRNPQDIVLSRHIMNRRWPTTKTEAKDWVEQLRPQVELGFTHFMVDGGPFNSPRIMDLFAEHVMEPLRERRG